MLKVRVTSGTQWLECFESMQGFIPFVSTLMTRIGKYEGVIVKGLDGLEFTLFWNCNDDWRNWKDKV